jgi:DNA uptake protein ComE-like DNA-binding protein
MRASCLSRRNRQRGMILLIVLGIVVVLSLIAYSMTFSVRVHLRISDNAVCQAESRYLAVAAVEQAIAMLSLDDSRADGLNEVWQDPLAFEPLELGAGSYEVSFPDPEAEEGLAYGLEDEAAKLNLNVASRDELLVLPGMTDSLVDALIDWRDEDETPGLFGAESDYYSALAEPYDAKNANLATLRELLYIRGFNETAIYGEDVNGNGLLDPNEDDGDISTPEDNADGVLDEGLLHYVTVYSADRNLQQNGQPRVNLQTASTDELMSGLSGISREEAEAIVAHRKQGKFESIANLLDVVKPTDEEAKKKPKSSLTESNPRMTRMNANMKDSRPEAESSSVRGSSLKKSDAVRGSRGSKSKGEPLFTTSHLQRWADAMTTSEEKVLPGLINLNTAPPEILATIEDLSENDITQIGLMRAAAETPFHSVGDLFRLRGMNAERFGRIAARTTVRSNQFTVRAKGVLASGRSRTQIEAVLERDENGVHVLYWRES